MSGITVNIARHCIEMSAVYPQTLSVCLPYQDEGPAEFTVETTIAEIEAERTRIAAKKPKAIIPDVTIESMILLRKTAEGMLDYDTLLIHGAVVAVDGNAYMFAAKSGTGKTTHINKWISNIPGAFVVNGDKPLTIVSDTPKVCGTPWCGKERMGCNAIVPLKAIAFMERSENNCICKISSTEAFPLLLGQVHRPDDPDKMRKTIKLLTSVSKSVSFYRFQCNNFKDDCFDVAYSALIGGARE